MAEKEKQVKVKPKPGLVRLNGSPSPVRGFNNRSGQNLNNLTKLCSFKAPRDLTLGAAGPGAGQNKTPDKKKFIPNLNVTRNIKKESNNENIPGNHKNSDNKRKGNIKKERDVKKEKPQLIQTTGSVFAEGIGALDAGGRRKVTSGGGGGGRVGGGDTGDRAEVKFSYNKEEEEQRLQQLMSDDFIDDLKSGDCIPVQLPMIETGELH